jgi:hypothetical protein
LPYKYCIAFFFSLAFSSIYGQLTTAADFKRQVYQSAYSVGLNFNTRGYAINARFIEYIDGFNARGLEVEGLKIRHPKEVITSNDVINNTRGFVLGRTNSFYSLRIGYIHEHIMFDKTDQGSVSISWVASGGLSLGLLKPIYLRVAEVTNTDGTILVTRRYVGDTPPANIQGEASFLTGIGQTKLQPGIYGKFGISFDYQLLDEKITSLEAGIAYDYFFTEVPIFYEEDDDINWSGFFQMYISFNFGNKKSQ